MAFAPRCDGRHQSHPPLLARLPLLTFFLSFLTPSIFRFSLRSSPTTFCLCPSLVSPTSPSFAASTIARWSFRKLSSRFSGCVLWVEEETRRLPGGGEEEIKYGEWASAART